MSRVIAVGIVVKGKVIFTKIDRKEFIWME